MKPISNLIIAVLVLTAIQSIGQNEKDSIYGLEYSIYNDTMQAVFYSTYPRENFKSLDVVFENRDLEKYESFSTFWSENINDTTLYSDKGGEYTYVVQNGIGRFFIKIALTEELKLYPFKVNFFTWGNNYKSNWLHFFFEPTITHIIKTDITLNKKITVHYFDLTGRELFNLPSYGCFIEKVLNDEHIILSKKCISTY